MLLLARDKGSGLAVVASTRSRACWRVLRLQLHGFAYLNVDELGNTSLTRLSTATMSHRKRSRTADDDGSPEVEIESASSSFRQTYNKRSRVTLASERGGSVVSDEEDYLAGFEEEAEEDFAVHQSSSGDEDEEDDLDVGHATQVVTKEMREFSENLASDQGVIQEVYCRNFMCHSNLRVKFGPLINFIIGHNGSGKSAVLTALQVCLGGRATSTNRGKGIKDMIKEGQESATLAVKIKNEGEDAYKPELYGVSITVERHFNRAGSSGFRLKNDADKVVSTRKSDLDDILDFFALQLDNPINVLTQDLARAFLSNSTPTEKYKFFIRGTQLENLDRDYKLTEDRLDNTQEKLRLREDDIAILKAKAQKAEERKKQLDRAANIHAKMEETRRLHAWTQVKLQEDVVAEAQDNVDAQQAKIRELEEAAETVSANFEAQDGAREAAQRAVTALKEVLPPLEKDAETKKENFEKNKNELVKAQREQRDIKVNVKKYKADVTRLEGHIREEETRLAGADGEAHAARMRHLEELKEAVTTAEREHNEHSAGKADVDRRLIDANKGWEEAKSNEEKATQASDTARRGLERLQQGQGSPYAPYPPNMERLVAAINKETRWKVKPVGPMGMHVHLLQPKWSSILEKTFGAILGGFVVTNRPDQDLLSHLSQKVGCQVPSYINNNTQPMDMTGKEPPEGVDTILRVLRIDNVLVQNTLIIQNYIETTCLIEHLKDAQAFMYPENGQPRHERVKATICISRNGYGTRLDVTRSGASKSSPVQPWQGATRMKVDQAEQLRLQEQRVQDARRAMDAAQTRVREARDVAVKAKQALELHKRQEQRFKTAVQTAEDAVEALEAEIDSNRPQDGKLQALQAQLQEAKDEQTASEEAFQDSVVAKDKLDDIARQLMPEMEEAQLLFAKQKRRIENAEVKVANCDNARIDSLHVKNEALEKVKSAQNLLTELEKRRDRKQNELTDVYIKGASEVCPRVPTEPGLTVEEIDERMERFKAQYAQEQKQAGGTMEELTLAHVAAHKAYSDAKSQMESLSETSKVSLTHPSHSICPN
jgi:chromosome segregation ATPase